MVQKTRRPLGDRLLESGWLAIALCVPLVINPWGQNIFALPKAALLRTLVFLMLGVWIADRLLHPSSAERPSTRLPVALPAVVLLGVIAVATALATNPALSFWGSHGRSQGALTLVCLPVLTLLVASRLPGTAGAQRLFWALSAVVLPLAVYAGVQLLGPDPLGVVTDARTQLFATLGRSNFLAAYLAMLVPFTLTLRTLSQRPALKALATVLGLMALAVVIATQVRAGLLATLVAIVCWTGLIFRHRLRVLAQGGAVRVAALSLAALAMAAGLWFAQAGGSGAARLAIWQATQKLIAARPLLGYGPDSLVLVFPRVYPPELVYYHGRGLSVDRAHNVVLDWSVTLGIVGLVAGAAFLYVVVRTGLRSLAAPSLDRPRELLVIGALAALAGNLAGNLVTFDVLPTLAASWILAGVVVALGQPVTSAAIDPPTTGPRRAAVARQVAAALILLLAVGAVAFFNLRPLWADVLAQRASRLAAAGQWDAAVLAAEGSVKIFPAEPVYRQQLGWIHLQMAAIDGPSSPTHLAAAERALGDAVAQRPDDYLLTRALAEFHGAAALKFDRRHLGPAEEAWKAATALAPNHGILYGAWGSLRLQAGDPDGAVPLLRKAVDLDATDTEAWILLADLELRQGRLASALVMYRQAARQAPDRPDPLVGLARTYWLLGQPEAAREAVLEALARDPANAATMALEQEFSLSQETPTSDPE